MKKCNAAFAPASAFTPRTALRAPSPACSVRRRRTAAMTLASEKLPSVLQEILARKQTEVAVLRSGLSANSALSEIVAKKGSFEQLHKFRDAINLPNGSLAVIAEIKRKSPSKGEIARLRDPTQIARVYNEGGANCISVLTDLEGFGGTLDDLARVVKAQKATFGGRYPGPCPVIRKDFVIDELQIAEAVMAGASAVLLIVSALGGERTKELLEAARAYGLDALVEVHDEAELEIALKAGADIVGVNNRNLNNFDENLDNSLRLAEKIPEGVVSVAESGIKECVDAWKFRDAGYNAILVGEALVRAFEGSSDGNTGYSPGFNEAKGLLKAFRSKGSSAFGRTTNAAFFGKGEGAKETLGELSI